jgi:hypothetical protein
VVFSKKIFVADSNEIAVNYRIGCVEFRHKESSGHRPKITICKIFLALWVALTKIATFKCFFGVQI